MVVSSTGYILYVTLKTEEKVLHNLIVTLFNVQTADAAKQALMEAKTQK